jgi:hypothetical protein
VTVKARQEVERATRIRLGIPYRESTQTTDEKKAGDFLRKRLGEIATGQFSGLEPERIRVTELAEDFLREYRINGRKSLYATELRWRLHIKPFFGHLRVVHITSTLLSRYVGKRQSEKAQNATINRELAALKRMFRFGPTKHSPKGSQAADVP